MRLLKSILKKKLYILMVIFLNISMVNAEINKDVVKENNLGIAYMGQFDFIKAYNIFEKLVKTNPKNLKLKINLAIATLNRQERGDEKIALSLLSDVLEKDKNNLNALYCSGLLELYLGNPAKALNLFNIVHKKDPQDPEVLYFIGKTLIQLSRYDESIDYFDKTISMNQYLSSAYYGLVLAYRQLGKRNIAMEKIKDFQNIKNNPRTRSLEFKYTKMGKKAEVLRINEIKKKQKASNLKGPIFNKVINIIDKKIELMNFNKLKDGMEDSITICDINGDGLLDIFISGISKTSKSGNIVLLKNKNTNKYEIKKNHPLAKVQNVNTALWGDINNDMITDVYLCRNGKNQLWQQDKAGNWTNISKKSRIENGNLNTIDGLLFDADHDGDLDIFLINEDGPNELLNNDRDGAFRPLAKKYGLSKNPSNSRSLITADLDNDRDVDIIIINKKGPHEVFINDRLWKYHRTKGYEKFISADISSAVSGDLNADGNIEIYTQSSKGKIFVWEKNKNIWGNKILIKGSENKTLFNNQLALEDVNGDGKIDLIYSDNKGLKAVSIDEDKVKVIWSSSKGNNLNTWTIMNSIKGPSIIALDNENMPLLWSPGSGRYDFTLLNLSGTKKDDLSWRSNSSGIGTRVSVRIGSSWTVFDTFKSNSGSGQSYQPLMLGLNGSKSIDFIAIDWSDGVFQTELNLKKGKTHFVYEKQRQLSSCPVLFAWNGEKIDFVSDLLGVGGMGYAIAPGEYAPPRPWENYLFPKGSIKPKNNKFIIKLTEPMEEATYLDSVKLISYDLPDGWAMTLDERMGISGPEPTGKTIFYKNILNPIKAFNDRGEDVIKAILNRDLKAAEVGRLDRRFVGMLEKDNVLTIEFSENLGHFDGEPVLVIDGWVEYPYSQTNFAAWQADATYKAPTIEIEREDGSWEILLEQFGYPAGMPRQMSVPLGKNLNGVKRIRLSTNQEIYWDKIIVVFAENCTKAIRQELKTDMAILEEIGFPNREESRQHLPYYDFSNIKPLWDTHFLEGYYTRFGRVEELLNKKDNALAIFGAGEGITITFIEPVLKPKAGWKRFFVLETHGWCKDMDLYTKDNETLAPIPSKGKTDVLAKKLIKKYNNRYLNGKQ